MLKIEGHEFIYLMRDLSFHLGIAVQCLVLFFIPDAGPVLICASGFHHRE